ncbi:MAG: IS1634 family transposase [Bifidobacteriaceae bacterium]|jgi:hypothetical protein|nr:IS1634 family transposase [Bifidobacteriaceae bacterium]
MVEPKGPLRVARVRSNWRNRDGTLGAHESALLRQTWRDGAKVRHRTLASLTHMPAAEVDALEAVLNRGERPGPSGPVGAEISGGTRHGDVAAVWAMADKLGLPGLLGPAGPRRDQALALVVARLARPASKLATLAWLADTTLGRDLGLDGMTSDDAYEAMDWLGARQGAVEQALAAKHLMDPAANPARLALFDLTSTWVEGTCCPLAEFGYSRDKKRGKRQIEFAILAAPDGTPVAVRPFKGSTSDPTAALAAIKALAEEFKMDRAVLVGDRGMVTNTTIADLKANQMGWVGALKRPQIKALADDQGPLQMSLFDTQDLAEITSPDYPGERLIACDNPPAGAHRAAKRERLVEATLADLAKVMARVEKGRLRSERAIGVAVGKVIDAHHAARFVQVRIGPGEFAYGRNQPAIAQDAMLDGIYVIRTSLTADQMGAADAVLCYKRLSKVEQDFASMKGFDVQVRPIWHHLGHRVASHLLICLLAAHLAFHLRKAWAPITFADEEPDPAPDPVKPRKRSTSSARKASTRKLADGTRARSFRDVLDHLSLIQRSTVTVTVGAQATILERTAVLDTAQAEAFRLIGATMPTRFSPS